MKSLPIGIDNFNDVIKGNLYYVDKTLVIEELLEKGNGVVLFPRPRRFGKSLLMSMLEHFFDIDKKENSKTLFNGLNISKSKYYSELSKYPVIHLDFKSLKQNSFEESYEQFKMLISNIYSEKMYLIEL